MNRTVAIYSEDARQELRDLGFWCGTRRYDDATKDWIARSGHYLDAPPPGALMVVSLEPFAPGLFGPVPSGALHGLAVLGRPVARNLPQDSTWAELTRFVLARELEKMRVASLVLRVAAELWFGRPRAERLISYHDRSRHSGCIYRKAGFRKDGVTRAGTRRGTWGSRGGESRRSPRRRRRSAGGDSTVPTCAMESN